MRRLLSWRYTPAVVGIVGMLASAVGADWWAIRSDRPTVSATGETVQEHSIGGPIYMGLLFGLGWHLVGDPIIRRIIDARS